MKAVPSIFIFCVVAFLWDVALVHGSSEAGDVSCPGMPPDGVWTLKTLVLFPGATEETLTARAIVRLVRETGNVYRGTGCSVLMVEAGDSKPGLLTPYDILAIFNSESCAFSVSIVNPDIGLHEVNNWVYDGQMLAGEATNIVGGTLLPIPGRQELEVLG